MVLAFFEELKKDLLRFDFSVNKPEYKPIITSYDTTCVCRLNTNISDKLNHLFFEKILKNTDKLIPKYDSQLTVTPFSLKFRIEYSNISSKLSKNKITLSR